MGRTGANSDGEASGREGRRRGVRGFEHVPGDCARRTGCEIWFATGGKTARVFHSGDRGQSWEVVDTPMVHGPDSAGIFSIAFRDAMHGVIAGGDYKHPNDDGPNLAFTEDGGKTWTLSELHPLAYFSAVAYDRKVNDQAMREAAVEKAMRVKAVAPERIFIVGRISFSTFGRLEIRDELTGRRRWGLSLMRPARIAKAERWWWGRRAA